MKIITEIQIIDVMDKPVSQAELEEHAQQVFDHMSGEVADCSEVYVNIYRESEDD